MIRQPSIQLRSRAPWVNVFLAWRCAQALQSCGGCLIATSLLRTLPSRDCFMLRIMCGEFPGIQANAWQLFHSRKAKVSPDTFGIPAPEAMQVSDSQAARSDLTDAVTWLVLGFAIVDGSCRVSGCRNR